MNLRHLSFEDLLSKIDGGHNFTLSRHKDGEFYAILQNNGRTGNCDRHTYFKSMGASLLHTIVCPQEGTRRIYGIQPYVFKSMEPAISQLFKEFDIQIDWRGSDVFHNAVRDGKMYPFIRALREREVLLIGPNRIRPIQEHIKFDHFIEVPQKDCWLDRHRILKELMGFKASLDMIILFSSSMPTAVFIHEIYPYLGGLNTIIDFGSIWEALLGIPIRSYQRAISKETIERNLHG